VPTEVLQPLRFILAAALVLWVPGAALLAWLPQSRRRAGRYGFDLFTHLADSVALSVSISSIIALALFLMRISLAPLVVASLYVLALLALGWGLLRQDISLPRGISRWWVSALSLALLAALVAWRFYQARGLALPAWVDSVHHALIARVILEQGRLPADLSPYMAVPFSYHYSFHLIAALFAGWSGFPVDEVLLRFGQVLNALAAVSVYRLAQFFTRDRQPENAPLAAWAPVKPLLAVLLVGFVFQMPAYYLTWGRYTMLTGLLLLGPLLVAAAEIYENPHKSPAWVRFGLLLAGMCLAHYFTLILAALFLLLLGVVCLVRAVRQPAARQALVRLVLIGVLAVLVASPWLLRAWHDNQRQAQLQVVSPLETQAETVKKNADYLAYLLQLVGPRRGHILLGIAAAGLLFSLRRPSMRLLAGWAILLALMALPWGIRLGPFRPDHYAIALFFPASIFIADLLIDGAAAFRRVVRPPGGAVVLAVLTAALLAWGLKETKNIVNPVTVFANPADLRALRWVAEHTPVDARFYNNAVHWQSGTYRGVDGGAWLLPYAARQSLVPPVVYTWGSKESVEQITRWAESTTHQKGCTPEFKALGREAGLTFIYLRQGQGSLQPDMLAGCAGIEIRYQQDGVFIYEILPSFLSSSSNP